MTQGTLQAPILIGTLLDTIQEQDAHIIDLQRALKANQDCQRQQARTLKARREEHADEMKQLQADFEMSQLQLATAHKAVLRATQTLQGATDIMGGF